jgi:hypothetical protein
MLRYTLKQLSKHFSFFLLHVEMKVFTYPSKIEVFTGSSTLKKTNKNQLIRRLVPERKKAELPSCEAARLSLETRGFPYPFCSGVGFVSCVLFTGYYS